MDKKKARSLSERLIWIEENLMALIVLAVTVVLFINVLLRYFSGCQAFPGQRKPFVTVLSGLLFWLLPMPFGGKATLAWI